MQNGSALSSGNYQIEEENPGNLESLDISRNYVNSIDHTERDYQASE